MKRYNIIGDVRGKGPMTGIELVKDREKKKQDLYRRYGLNLIELSEKDIQNIDDMLPKKLRRFFPSSFKITWLPSESDIKIILLGFIY